MHPPDATSHSQDCGLLHATIIFPPSRHGKFPRTVAPIPVPAVHSIAAVYPAVRSMRQVIPSFPAEPALPAALPHDRRAAVGLEVGVRLREVAAAEKPPVRRQRRRMHRLEDTVARRIDDRALALRVRAPQHVDDPVAVRGDRTHHRIGELFQPLPACEAGSCARTVSTALSSSTPCDAQRSRLPLAGTAARYRRAPPGIY